MKQYRLQRPSGEIAYTAQGNGPLLVLLHPIGMDSSWWDVYVRAWSGRYRVVSIDMLGHGESGLVREPHGLAEHAADVLAVIAKEDAGSAVIIGVSMGGMVAQYAALQAPTAVAGLILCATAGGFPDAARSAIRSRGDVTRPGEMQSVVEATIDRWFTRQSDIDVVERCRARLLKDDWHSWSANWVAISQLNTLAQLPAVRAPILVVAGDADISIPVAVSKQIADAATSARFVVMMGEAHFGAFESPALFRAEFDTFLQSLTY